MNATKLTASQEAALDYLESKALKNDPEAQAVAMMLRKKKYGHTLPQRLIWKFDTKILDLL